MKKLELILFKQTLEAALKEADSLDSVSIPFELFQSLEAAGVDISALKAILKGANSKFRYGIIKNRDNINPEIKKLQEIEKGYKEGIKAFDIEKEALIIKFGEGNAKEGFSINEKSPNWKIFSNQLTALKKKNKTALDIYDAKMSDFLKTTLEEDIPESEMPEIFHIDISNVPEKLSTKLLKELIVYKVI
jgi:hypothetical protein